MLRTKWYTWYEINYENGEKSIFIRFGDKKDGYDNRNTCESCESSVLLVDLCSDL